MQQESQAQKEDQLGEQFGRMDGWMDGLVQNILHFVVLISVLAARCFIINSIFQPRIQALGRAEREREREGEAKHLLRVGWKYICVFWFGLFPRRSRRHQLAQLLVCVCVCFIAIRRRWLRPLTRFLVRSISFICLL